MPHILYVIGQLDRGGAEQQLYYLLEYLRPRATVVSLSQGGHWADPIRALGYKVIELDRCSGWRRFTRVWRVAKIIKSERPDIVHLFSDGISGLYGRLATLITRHPCVVVGERRHPSLDAAWYSLLKRTWLNRYVSAIVANARSSVSYLTGHDRLPSTRAVFIPNGLELSRFAPSNSTNAKSQLPASWQDKVIVGMVCGLRPKKAPDVFVRVAGKVLSQCPDVRFLHVGDGPLRSRVELLSHELGIGDSIKFLGLRHNVPELLRAMDLFMLTSRNEGMPNAIMEAMASGLPCVTTDVGDCRELVSDGKTGFVVPADDEDELVNRILLLITDETLRRNMGRRGSEKIGAFDLRFVAQQYQELYASVLATS